MDKKIFYWQQGTLLPEFKSINNSIGLEAGGEPDKNRHSVQETTPQTLSQFKFIIPVKSKGSKNIGNNYVTVTAGLKGKGIRKTNRFEIDFRRFLQSQNLDPQIAAIGFSEAKIAVVFDNDSYQNGNYRIIKGAYTIVNHDLVEILFDHFQEKLDTCEGATSRFFLEFTKMLDGAYVFEKVVLCAHAGVIDHLRPRQIDHLFCWRRFSVHVCSGGS